MDYRIPEFLFKAPEPGGWEEKLFDTLERYEGKGLGMVRLAAIPWNPESIDRFMEDLEYCIQNNMDYYDLRPEHRETKDNYY